MWRLAGIRYIEIYIYSDLCLSVYRLFVRHAVGGREKRVKVEEKGGGNIFFKAEFFEI